MTSSRGYGRTLDWAVETGGALSPGERRALWWPIARGFATYAAGVPRYWIGRPVRSVEVPPPPDSGLARAAEAAAAEQPPELAGHGYRTWFLGRALATLDGARLDAEVFYVASLLHDFGLASAVLGEDFTIRSATRITEVCDAHVDQSTALAMADAVVAHATPGLAAAEDAVGFYIQAGAMADLIGLRSWELSRPQVQDAFARFPAHDVHRKVSATVRREAKAVPHGRFALLARSGLPLVMRLSPMRTP